MHIACLGILLDIVEAESYTTSLRHVEYHPAVTFTACMYSADTPSPKGGVGWRQKSRDAN